MNVASRRRLLVLYVVAAAMLVSLGGRLWYLQVHEQHRVHQARRRRTRPGT